jgi:hypothetical protein
VWNVISKGETGDGGKLARVRKCDMQEFLEGPATASCYSNKIERQ